MFPRFLLKAFHESFKSSFQHFSRITKSGVKIVTLLCMMMKNGQTNFKVFTPQDLLKYVLPFFNVMHEKVKFLIVLC